MSALLGLTRSWGRPLQTLLTACPNPPCTDNRDLIMMKSQCVHIYDLSRFAWAVARAPKLMDWMAKCGQ